MIKRFAKWFRHDASDEDFLYAIVIIAMNPVFGLLCVFGFYWLKYERKRKG